MRVAVVLFDGFDEVDAFTVFGLCNRLSASGWRAQLAGSAAQVSSVGGLTVTVPQPLEFANEADAVIFCGSLYARAIAENSAVLDRLQIDPLRQCVGAQSSGALLLARLGLLGQMPACSEPATRSWLVEAGVRVVDAPFHARGPLATAAGSLAALQLATWLIWRGAGEAAASQVLQGAAPVGAKDVFARQLVEAVRPFVTP